MARQMKADGGAFRAVIKRSNYKWGEEFLYFGPYATKAAAQGAVTTAVNAAARGAWGEETRVGWVEEPYSPVWKRVKPWRETRTEQ